MLFPDSFCISGNVVTEIVVVDRTPAPVYSSRLGVEIHQDPVDPTRAERVGSIQRRLVPHVHGPSVEDDLRFRIGCGELDREGCAGEVGAGLSIY